MKNFPQGFLWGSATSSHQVEGGNKNDWAMWEAENAERLSQSSPRRYVKFSNWPEIRTQVQDPANYLSGVAADHYNRFREDFDLAKQLHHNAHRFSVEWSRIEPQEGKFDTAEFDHYKKVIAALRERGIEPFLTIWHWTLPLWVRKQGGWVNPKTIGYFRRYVEQLVNHLGQNVDLWITINEPMVYATQGYLTGHWLPNHRWSLGEYLAVIRNLIVGHKEAYTAIHRAKPNAKVGIAKNNIHFGHFGVGLRNFQRWWWNRRFLDKIRDYQDFVGINYYFGSCVPTNSSDLGWAICPEGIWHVLHESKRYGKPIYITENGLADAKDTRRLEFITSHLSWVHRAISEGVDVRGYLYWSLLDNFEWDKGFWPRFGLVEVDYTDLSRTVRDSAKEFSLIIKQNALPNE